MDILEEKTLISKETKTNNVDHCDDDDCQADCFCWD